MRYVTILNGVVDNVVIADEVPPRGVQSDTANVGDLYDGENFTPAPPPPPPAPPVYDSFIDVGPFFDRFGAAKMAVLMSTDPVVQAILKDVQVRKWIDLSRQDVLDSLNYISSKVPSLTSEIVANVIHLPVEDAENMALRKLYFS